MVMFVTRRIISSPKHLHLISNIHCLLYFVLFVALGKQFEFNKLFGSYNSCISYSRSQSNTLDQSKTL